MRKLCKLILIALICFLISACDNSTQVSDTVTTHDVTVNKIYAKDIKELQNNSDIDSVLESLNRLGFYDVEIYELDDICDSNSLDIGVVKLITINGMMMKSCV